MYNFSKICDMCSSVGLPTYKIPSKYVNKWSLREFYLPGQSTFKFFNWTSAIVMYKEDWGVKILKQDNGKYCYTLWLVNESDIDEAFKNLSKLTKEIRTKAKIMELNGDFLKDGT